MLRELRLQGMVRGCGLGVHGAPTGSGGWVGAPTGNGEWGGGCGGVVGKQA